jgi:hypothetical protein
MKFACRFLVAGLAVTVAACSSGGGAAATTTSPSSAPVVTATIAQPAPSPMAAFVGGGCLVGARLTPITPIFDVVIVSTGTINMQQLTLELGDGSHVGGPMVTFPQASLTSLFGSTIILGGTPALFTVRPNLTCGSKPMRTISAGITFRDSAGSIRMVTAGADLH